MQRSREKGLGTEGWSDWSWRGLCREAAHFGRTHGGVRRGGRGGGQASEGGQGLSDGQETRGWRPDAHLGALSQRGPPSLTQPFRLSRPQENWEGDGRRPPWGPTTPRSQRL